MKCFLYVIGPPIPFLTEELILELIEECKKEKVWSKLIRLVGSTFNNPDILMKSFLLKPNTQTDPDKDSDTTNVKSDNCDASILSPNNDKGDNCDSRMSPNISEATTEQSMIDMSPKRSDDGHLSDISMSPNEDLSSISIFSKKNISVEDADKFTLNVDMESLRRTYAALMELPDTPFQGAMINALRGVTRTVELELRYHQMYERNSDCLNIFIICMEIPLLASPEFIENAFPQLCKAMGQLPLAGQARLARIWSSFGASHLHEMVQTLHQMITVRIVQNEGRWGRSFCINDDDGLTNATKVMKILYYASIYGDHNVISLNSEDDSQNEVVDALMDLQGAFAIGHEPKETRQPKDDPLATELKVSVLDSRKPLVPYDEFVNETLNENIDLETDYKYKLENDTKFSFMNCSFILTTASKQKCMNFDNRVRMYNERRTSIQQTVLFGIPPVPYLRLRVRRDHLIDDALVNVSLFCKS